MALPDELTVVGAPKLGAGLNAGAGVLTAGALLPKLGAGVIGAGVLGGTLNVAPALSPNFSCVRPYAAIPSMAPMAMWNRPAPCSVIGDHCVSTRPPPMTWTILHNTGTVSYTHLTLPTKRIV